MARYVDADKAKELWSGEHPTQIAMRRIFDDLPTADVVPKSEVELPPELPTEVRNKVNERARKAVQKLYEKAYQDAIEYPENYGDIFEGYENNLPTALALINWQKMEIESLTINMNAYGLAAKRLAEQKTEVARKIFEEIENLAMSKIDADLSVVQLNDAYYIEAIDELKKKYTEGNDG